MNPDVAKLTAKGRAKLAKRLREQDWKVICIADELGVEERAVYAYLAWNGTAEVINPQPKRTRSRK